MSQHNWEELHELDAVCFDRNRTLALPSVNRLLSKVTSKMDDSVAALEDRVERAQRDLGAARAAATVAAPETLYESCKLWLDSPLVVERAKLWWDAVHALGTDFDSARYSSGFRDNLYDGPRTLVRYYGRADISVPMVFLAALTGDLAWVEALCGWCHYWRELRWSPSPGQAPEVSVEDITGVQPWK